MRRVAWPGGAFWLCVAMIALCPALAAGAEGMPAHATIDRVAVRYYAPETGGSAHPRFVTERMLSFEARLDALAEQAPETSAVEERFVRSALDCHVAEDMLSALAVQSGTTMQDITAQADEERTGLVERVGGARRFARRWSRRESTTRRLTRCSGAACAPRGTSIAR